MSDIHIARCESCLGMGYKGRWRRTARGRQWKIETCRRCQGRGDSATGPSAKAATSDRAEPAIARLGAPRAAKPATEPPSRPLARFVVVLYDSRTDLLQILSVDAERRALVEDAYEGIGYQCVRVYDAGEWRRLHGLADTTGRAMVRLAVRQ